MAIKDKNLDKAIRTGDVLSDRGPSETIWANCPTLELSTNPFRGLFYQNDFVEPHTQATNTASAHIKNGVYGFTTNNAASVITDADEQQGAITLSSILDTNALDTGIMVLGGANNYGHLKITAGKRLWLEGRLKVSSITNAKLSFYFGLGQVAKNAAGGLITATSGNGALASVTNCGYHLVQSDGDAILAKYATTTTAATTAASATIVPAADTYFKLGLYFDGDSMNWIANGVKYASVRYNTTNFPDALSIAAYLQLSAKDTSAVTCTMDWIRIAQEW